MGSVVFHGMLTWKREPFPNAQSLEHWAGGMEPVKDILNLDEVILI